MMVQALYYRARAFAVVLATLSAVIALDGPARAQSDQYDALYRMAFADFGLTDAGQIRLGREIEQAMLNQSGSRYVNESLQDAVTDFAQPLFLATGRRSFPWRITVVDNDIPSGWALPGGHVVIYRGLLGYVDSADELAMVIAHLMAHAEQDHLTMAMKGRAFLNRLSPDDVGNLLRYFEQENDAAILSGRVLDVLRPAIAEVIRSGYGTAMESEADVAAAAILSRAGYDAGAGSVVLETIAALVPVGRDGTTCLFGGHDNLPARLSALRTTASPQSGERPGDIVMPIIKSMFPTRQHYGFAAPREDAP